MTDQELLEIESALAQYRSALREVGNTANLQAATEEVLVVATGLIAEVRRLNGLIEQCERVFTWKLRNDNEWTLWNANRRVDYLYSTTIQRGKVWGHACLSGYFDTAEEARAWAESRLRASGIIKPIDVVEVRP